MSTPPTILPVLTPEEWAAAYIREPNASLGFHQLHTELVHAADVGNYAGAAALANAARGDDDAGKLRYEDVVALRRIMSSLTTYSAGADEDIPAAERLANKLAAMLPPEGR
jgi:hypothetical protein